MTRRELLALIPFIATSATFRLRGGRVSQHDDPTHVDYHAHLGEGITLDDVLKIGRARNVKFGVLQHAGQKGHGYAVSNDDQLLGWIHSLEGKPVFKGVEGEGLDWPSAFSMSAIAKLDYAQSDPLGMPDKTGKVAQLWRPDFRCDGPQDFMDRYTDFHVELISTLPIDILVVPTFLPDSLQADYDRLWTDKRMEQVIGAAVRYHVAIEIDTRFRVPRRRFLEAARDAGATFAFGSNYQTKDRLGDISYGTEMYHRLGLTADRLFLPRAGKKRSVSIYAREKEHAGSVRSPGR